MKDVCTEGSDLRGKVCLITGATSGIGKEIAKAVSRMGASLIMVCRDMGRAMEARAEIIGHSGNDAIEILLADLSSKHDIRAVAAEFKKTHERLHLLVNNAAIVPKTRQVTIDGLEMQFMVNHLAYFMMTDLLLDTLKSSAPSRIVLVSSGMHRRYSKIDMDDLQFERRYKSMDVYGRTKLLNILFMHELARRLEGTGVTVNACTPGFTATGLGRHQATVSRFFMRALARKVSKGARTPIFVATSPELEGVSGGYFAGCKEAETSELSKDVDLQRRLWEMSERLSVTS